MLTIQTPICDRFCNKTEDDHALLMSKYTTTFNNFVESYWLVNGVKDGKKHSRQEKIQLALDAIFDFDYPIWDDDYRKKLEYEIVTHYFLDEIAFETWGQFKMYLEDWMNREMPRFNVLYKAGESIGDIFSIGYWRTDEYHGTDGRTIENTGTQGNMETKVNTGNQTNSEIRENTGTQSNSGERINTGTQSNNGTTTNTGTQNNTGSTMNTGTQNNTGSTTNTGTQTTEESSSSNEWNSNRDVPENGDFTDDSYVSKASHINGNANGDSKRTDNLTEETSNTRTDNLKEESSSTRTDNLREESNSTRADNLREESINTRTDNLKEEMSRNRVDDLHQEVTTTRTDDLKEEVSGKEDNKRVVHMVNEVQDKMNLYDKLWRYYNNIDNEIIYGMSCLFLQIW